jgi:hypothetical protein
MSPDEDECILAPEPEPEEPAPRQRRKKGQWRQLDNFARVPAQWLVKPHRPSPFDPAGSLFLYLIVLSKEGREKVPLTDAVGAEIGLSPRTKRRAAKRLIKTGWVRVVGHRGRGRTPIVMPLVMTSVD